MRPAAHACINGAATAEGVRSRSVASSSRRHAVRPFLLASHGPLPPVASTRFLLTPSSALAACCDLQEALKSLRQELAASLADVEKDLEALGGSASTVTAASMSQKSMKSTKARSVKAPSTVAEEDEQA